MGNAAHLFSLDSYLVIGREPIHGVDHWISGLRLRARLGFLIFLRDTLRARPGATGRADTFLAVQVPERSTGIMVVSCLGDICTKVCYVQGVGHMPQSGLSS